jgi:hypothetical protein
MEEKEKQPHIEEEEKEKQAYVDDAPPSIMICCASRTVLRR